MTSARTFGLTVMGNSGGEELVICPFHDDKNASSWWNPKKDMFFCAVCNMGLNAAQLVQRLGMEGEVDLDDLNPTGEPEDYNLIVADDQWEMGVFGYHPYMQERGISVDVARRFGLRYTDKAIVIPIPDIRNRISGVQYRYFNPHESGTRYRTMGKVEPVWPMSMLTSVGEDPPFVCEGAWSAMRMSAFFEDMYQFRPCFALMGAKANQSIVDVLRPLNPFILYDGDKAGETACRKLRKLWPSVRAWTVSTSPDDMTNEQIGELLWRIGRKT